MKKNGNPEKNNAKPSDLDALNIYLRKISKIPLLTREEEAAVARRVQEGDQKAANELVRRNLRYVVSVANKYKGCGLSLSDLISEGNIGLIQAAKRFDPNRDVKFITYAVWWIRQAILHALAEHSRTVRLPIKQAGLLYKIGGKYQQLTQDKGREPTTQELAQELNMEVNDIESILRVYRTYLSLDSPIKENDETSYIDLLEASSTSSVEDNLLKLSLSKEIDEILKQLPLREGEVLKLRHGFEGKEPMTLEEIGQKMGLSRERVRQIEKKAINRLRSIARTKTLRDYLN